MQYCTVCMYVCMCVCTYMYPHAYPHTHTACICTCTPLHTLHTHACTHTYICAGPRTICTRACMHTCNACVSVFLCYALPHYITLYVCVCVCVCSCVPVAVYLCFPCHLRMHVCADARMCLGRCSCCAISRVQT